MNQIKQDVPLIETVHLKKYFDTGSGVLHAVDDVNLTIQPRKTLGVVGESGCGKSTLGRTILRLTPATEGQILYNGRDILSYNPHQLRELRREMQIIFQDPYSSLNPRMTVSELIAEPLVVNKVMKNKNQLKERVKELMETVGLAPRLENAYPHELDGGRRQRIGVARALSVNPKFIVCDEPVSALDVSIQAQILNLLMDLQENMGLTYMFITHDLSVVRHISDEIAVMYLGQCVERCGSKELFDNPLHPYTKALLDAIQVPDISLRGKKKPIIRGEVTSPIDPKPGCRFAARCPRATDACWGSQIPLREVSAGHYAACNLI
ncbi:ATP-binding cassette domain-containing protein [Lachnoclostridium pacaense]|uniref:ABC transporter ATP-binding protein n=1 Tax=Enterocloster hominis (ex Hitch et al. 2024) TaxID=1917870 RepID=UPI001D10F1E6|nr:oligopeptide/dipeptide ABC transporter ATP-binding protein [Lachnoclostridium pacaense]MCC2817549.1 ATP-binding cassette domain-containing protein [Lachnoclostridium pacaense]